MSKQSKNLKNSKAGKRQAAAKSAKKTAAKIREKHLEEVSTPRPLSLTKDQQGRPLTDVAQLLFGALGIFCIVFVVAYVAGFIIDIAAEGDAFSFTEYLQSCEPAVACRVADVSSILTIIFAAIVGIFSLKLALTNRHAKRKTFRIMLALLILALIFYCVEFAINRIFWS